MIPLVSDVTSATATFLFTDIEGSTQLLKAHRREYASILEDHHRILREAFSAYGGREVDNQGDSFFVAFPRARDAVLAAATAQRGIAEHSWPGGATVRVRMGIHTGEADLAADRYVGMSVHRAARISSVGHGGQVLVSPTTAGHLEDEHALPGITLRDLGEHRLKDIPRPVRLHQLDIDGLPDDFPPIRSEPREPSRRRRWILAGVAAVALPGAAVAAVLLSREAPPPEIVPNSVVRIDPQSLEPTQVVPVADGADFIVAAGGYMWVTHYIVFGGDELRSAGDRTLTRVDPSTGEAVTVGGGLAPCGMTADPSGDLWVTNCFAEGGDVRSNIVRLDAKTLRFKKTWPIESFGPESSFRLVTFGGGALWITVPGGDQPIDRIERIDPLTGARQRFPPFGDPVFLAWSEGYGDLWTSNGGPGGVWRLDVATGEAQHIEGVAASPGVTDVDGDTVWLADIAASQLVRLNAVGSPNPRLIGLPVEKAASHAFAVSVVAAGAGAVWAATPFDHAIWRIDPSTDEATRIPVPYTPFGVATDDESVWVTVGAD
jgi:class 3 adenylate cyclase/streptogramin lyase